MWGGGGGGGGGVKEGLAGLNELYATGSVCTCVSIFRKREPEK